MIQRIQTIYLTLIAGIMLAMFFLPVIEFNFPEALLKMTPMAFFALTSYSFLPEFLLPCLVLGTIILSLVTIFSYKKRKVQIKLCYWILVLLVLQYVFIFFYYHSIIITMPKVVFTPKTPLIFPLIAVILDFMAVAGIKKDEKLVRSLDRIR